MKKNIFSIIRKPYLALFMSTLILFVSCEQYDIDRIEHSFDYTAYESFNGKFLVTNLTDVRGEKSSYQDIVSIINESYETDIIIPNDELILTNKSLEEVQIEFLEKGYLTQQGLDLANVFLENLQQNKFDTALTAFENEVLNLKLKDDEFIRYNNSANVLKIINEVDSSLFDLQNQNSNRSLGLFVCAVALVYLAVATTELLLCATIILCLPALANFAWAAYTVDSECE